MLVCDDALCTVPPGSVHEQPVHIDSVLGRLLDLTGFFLVHDLERETQLVYGYLVVSGMSLEATCHEPLREEETRHPEGIGLTVDHPLAHEGHTVDQILVPRGQGLERGVSHLGPVGRHSSILEAAVHGVQLFTHHDETLDGFLDKDQRAPHDSEQSVEAGHLL